MESNRLPVLGLIFGDPAGSSPELVAMTILANKGSYIPVITGNIEWFKIACRNVKGFEDIRILPLNGRPEKFERNLVYFEDIPCGDDIVFSTITEDSGKLMYTSMIRMMELERTGIVDGFNMAPISKAGLQAAGTSFTSEFEIYAHFYKVPKVTSVIKCGDIFRSTVVGHCAFKDIVSKLTPEGIVSTAHHLKNTMKMFLPPEKCNYAVAALNPHAGEHGLFGDEESTIIQPAIDKLLAEGDDVIGPIPADTVFIRAINGTVSGVVFLYHDQGNIAMKSRFFGDGVLVYTNTPTSIVSVGHGPAYGKAGKGTADPKNMIAAMDVLNTLVRYKRKV